MKIKMRDKGNVFIFDIQGDLTLAAKAEVRLDRLVKDQLESGKKNILLNLKEMVFLDSSGVGEIVASLIFTQNAGGKLKITNISDKALLVLRYSRLTDIIEIFQDEKEAIKSFH